MTETRIDMTELKSEGSDLIKELSEFLKEKTKAKVERATNEIIVKSEEEAVPRTYIRVLLRKFLHKHELRELFKVIGGKENTLIIKEIKVSEEE
jgi:hypothetical protein